MSDQIKHLQAMKKNNERLIRILKRGFFPFSVAGDIGQAVDYLKNLNLLTEQQIKLVEKEMKNEPATVAEPEVQVSDPSTTA
jgi:predicted nucleic acid-binding protein